MNRTVVLQPAKRTPPNTSRNKSSNTQRTEVCTISIHVTKYTNWELNTKQPMKKYHIETKTVVTKHNR